MRFHHHYHHHTRVVAVLTMMLLLVTVRQTCAFVKSSTSGGSISISKRSFVHPSVPIRCPSFGITMTPTAVATATVRSSRFLQIRGGSSHHGNHGHHPRSTSSTIPQATTATAAASSSSSASSSNKSNSNSNSNQNDSIQAQIARETKASLSIVGTGVSAQLFAGEVPYLNTENFNEFRVLFVLGGPGAGKGTQCDLILNKGDYPCVHLSAGELLRAETTKDDSPHKELIEHCLVSGNIVPVEISLTLLQQAMQQAAEEQGRGLIFLVDGFPRNFDNLQGWMRCMPGVASVWGVLNYQCPLAELERRILQRAQEGSGRSDDNLQSARKRFATFERDTEPVVETLRQVQQQLSTIYINTNTNNNNGPAAANLKVFDIRGDQSIDSVWKDTQHAMNQMIDNDVLTANAQLLQAITSHNVELYRQLSADDWFENDDKDENKKMPEQILALHEGSSTGNISNVSINHISGTKVAVEYDHVLKPSNDNSAEESKSPSLVVRETRIWSYQGQKGWKNIHFARLPATTRESCDQKK